MHGGHDVMLNQNKETNHVLINLDNVAVPSVGLRFLSAERPCWLHNVCDT